MAHLLLDNKLAIQDYRREPLSGLSRLIGEKLVAHLPV